MLEEAAGTRLFEVKKDAALKTIDKKSSKVEEIGTVRSTYTFWAPLTMRRELSDAAWPGPQQRDHAEA